ncbi:PAS domain S-box protein [Nocardioides sp. HDW12B]|uniref:PAS domain S-box protein n=1 Tax=Nocardioides sp. HDW12B TaxID=2714939 RepID=UPI00140A9A80|nr:PAS domain S-box protein [Nocardioides sp. HDW12B]QIK67229.1 PAS domain S-box protein [Nocardioides sp. HDW12B]
METYPDAPAAWLRATPSIVYAFDAHGTCTMSEGPGLAQLGLRSGEMVGLDLFEVYADDQDFLVSMGRVLGGETFVFSREINGRVLETFLQPLASRDGGRAGALGVVSDLTDQRRLETEAQEHERRLRSLVELDAALARDVVDLPALLDTAVKTATSGTASSGSVWLLDPDGDRMRLAAFATARTATDEELRPPPGQATPEQLAIDRRLAEGIDRALLLDLDDTAARELYGDPFLVSWLRETGVHSALRVPLRARGALLGALDLVRRDGTPSFHDKDTDFAVDVAERVAMALDNALLLQSQREALEEQVKFKALADATSDLIAMTDTEAVATYVNARVADVGEEWVGRSMHDIFGSSIVEDVAAEVESSLAARGRWRGDLTLRDAASSTVARTEAFHIFHPESQEPLGTVWVAQDVTELRSAEQALRAANVELLRFKVLVDACPEFIAIAALDGTVLYVNPPGRAMVGMSPDVDVTTTRIADFLTEEGLERSLQIEQPAVIAHGSWEGESTLRDMRGGPAIPVQIASFLIRDPETGEPFALATVQRDLSDRVAAEEALRDLAEQRRHLLTRLVDAQDAERAHIAAEVHDDSVQSLAAVDLRLGLLARRIAAGAPHLLEYVDPLRATVTEATDRLRTLLFDLTPVDLDHGLATALRETAREIFDDSITEVDVVTEPAVDVPGSIPVPTLRVAHRIAREALINARKHARADRVRVSVRGRDGGIEVRVLDDGIGIPLDRASAAAGHLGLSTMQDRAQIAGGTWSAGRRAEGGTEVLLWLPGEPDPSPPPAR